jgi:hypothetical protein
MPFRQTETQRGYKYPDLNQLPEGEPMKRLPTNGACDVVFRSNGQIAFLTRFTAAYKGVQTAHVVTVYPDEDSGVLLFEFHTRDHTVDPDSFVVQWRGSEAYFTSIRIRRYPMVEEMMKRSLDDRRFYLWRMYGPIKPEEPVKEFFVLRLDQPVRETTCTNKP